MTLNYKMLGYDTIHMKDYVKIMLEEFPRGLMKTQDKVAFPWNNNLFKVQESSLASTVENKEQFHTTVAQSPFLYKHARLDIVPAISHLATHVREPNQYN